MSSSIQNQNNAHSEDTLMESPKGKGKAVQEDVPVDDSESDDDDDEADGEDQVDEDNLEEIDLENVVAGRTRNKNIDFAQAAKDLPDDDDDDDDDDDFEAEEDDEDRMEE